MSLLSYAQLNNFKEPVPMATVVLTSIPFLAPMIALPVEPYEEEDGANTEPDSDSDDKEEDDEDNFKRK
jgi:hypothetical protein